MYVPQLTLMQADAPSRSSILRGERSSGPVHAQCRIVASTSATETSDHSIRQARISPAPAGSSSGQ